MSFGKISSGLVIGVLTVFTSANNEINITTDERCKAGEDAAVCLSNVYNVALNDGRNRNCMYTRLPGNERRGGLIPNPMEIVASKEEAEDKLSYDFLHNEDDVIAKKLYCATQGAEYGEINETIKTGLLNGRWAEGNATVAKQALSTAFIAKANEESVRNELQQDALERAKVYDSTDSRRLRGTMPMHLEN